MIPHNTTWNDTTRFMGVMLYVSYDVTCLCRGLSGILVPWGNSNTPTIRATTAGGSVSYRMIRRFNPWVSWCIMRCCMVMMCDYHIPFESGRAISHGVTVCSMRMLQSKGGIQSVVKCSIWKMGPDSDALNLFKGHVQV